MHIGQTGINRDGLQVEVIDIQGIFAVVKATTGAVFSLHPADFFPDTDTVQERKQRVKAVRGWPLTDFSIALVPSKNGLQPSLKVAALDVRDSALGKALYQRKTTPRHAANAKRAVKKGV